MNITGPRFCTRMRIYKFRPLRSGMSGLGLIYRLLFYQAEAVFVSAAEGALEIVGQVFPLGAGAEAAFFVAFCLIIDPATDITYVFFHVLSPFILYIYLGLPQAVEVTPFEGGDDLIAFKKSKLGFRGTGMV